MRKTQYTNVLKIHHSVLPRSLFAQMLTGSLTAAIWSSRTQKHLRIRRIKAFPKSPIHFFLTLYTLTFDKNNSNRGYEMIHHFSLTHQKLPSKLSHDHQRLQTLDLKTMNVHILLYCRQSGCIFHHKLQIKCWLWDYIPEESVT